MSFAHALNGCSMVFIAQWPPPGLYLSEFGYLNQPRFVTREDGSQRRDPPRAWHTEWERRNWLYGPGGAEGALDQAERAGANWMLLYQAIEDGPTSLAQPSHDYGLFALAAPAGDSPDDGLVLGPDIHGIRDYNKNTTPADPYNYDASTRRRAYCVIRRWALEKDYFDPAAPDIDPTVPATAERANRRNGCPTPDTGRDEAEYQRANPGP
jgi:hypothetical protein